MLADAIATVFKEYVDKLGLAEIAEIFSRGVKIEVGDMLPRVPTQSDQHIMALPLREAREVFEKEYLIAQINRFGGNISKTSEFVGMERSALHRKLKSLGV